MKFFTIILCIGFFQVSYASRQDTLDELNKEAAQLKQQHFDRVEATEEHSTSLEFLDAYTKKMKESYSEVKEADWNLYLQIQDLNSHEDMTDKEFDFARSYAQKTIKKIKILHHHLATLQHIMTTIEYSNYLSEIKVPNSEYKTLQEPFQKTLHFLSNLISEIPKELKELGTNTNLNTLPSIDDIEYALKVIMIVKKINTPAYDIFHHTMGNLIKEIESYIKCEQRV